MYMYVMDGFKLNISGKISTLWNLFNRFSPFNAKTTEISDVPFGG